MPLLAASPKVSKSSMSPSQSYIEWHRPYSDETTARPPPPATTATVDYVYDDDDYYYDYDCEYNYYNHRNNYNTTITVHPTLLVPYAIGIATVVAVSTS